MKQKKSVKNTLATFALLSILLGGFSLAYIYYFTNWYSASIYYPDFGIYLPSDYRLHGIDVSHYQQRINWDQVGKMKKNDMRIRFAFMKATEGQYSMDPYFFRNWEQCRKQKIVRGAYHFFDPNGNAVNQANRFNQLVDLKAGDMPPVLDIETETNLSDQELRKKISQWLQTVEKHYKVKPIIYTYADYYEDHLAGSFEEYPLWIAHYTGSRNPRIGRKWHFWQHHENGHVNGIRGNVDFNVFNGSDREFDKLLLD